MTSGPSDTTSETRQTVLEDLELESSERIEAAYAELTNHTIAEEFEEAEHVAEDFYEDYRMLGRFEVLHALLDGDVEQFSQLLTETAAFVADEEPDR